MVTAVGKSLMNICAEDKEMSIKEADREKLCAEDEGKKEETNEDEIKREKEAM